MMTHPAIAATAIGLAPAAKREQSEMPIISEKKNLPVDLYAAPVRVAASRELPKSCFPRRCPRADSIGLYTNTKESYYSENM